MTIKKTGVTRGCIMQMVALDAGGGYEKQRIERQSRITCPLDLGEHFTDRASRLQRNLVELTMLVLVMEGKLQSIRCPKRSRRDRRLVDLCLSGVEARARS